MGRGRVKGSQLNKRSLRVAVIECQILDVNSLWLRIARYKNRLVYRVTRRWIEVCFHP